MSKQPLWCTKTRPCDYDKGSAYCPHRECRQKLESMLYDANETAVLAQHQLDAAFAENRRLRAMKASGGRRMEFGDYMRALDAMPGVADHPCNECCGTGAVAVRCCDGRECGCYGQPIDYRPCKCGTPFPTEEQLAPFVPKSASRRD